MTNSNLILFYSFLVLVSSALGAMLPHQGRVLISGTPFDGNATFRFALVEQSGGIVWNHEGGTGLPGTDLTIEVKKGFYQCHLGDTSITGMATLPKGIFVTYPGLKLRIWFNDGTNGTQQLGKDQPLLVAPYAMNVPLSSASANLLEGLAQGISQYATTSGVSSTQLVTQLTELAGKVATGAIDINSLSPEKIQELVRQTVQSSGGLLEQNSSNANLRGLGTLANPYGWDGQVINHVVDSNYTVPQGKVLVVLSYQFTTTDRVKLSANGMQFAYDTSGILGSGVVMSGKFTGVLVKENSQIVPVLPQPPIQTFPALQSHPVYNIPAGKILVICSKGWEQTSVFPEPNFLFTENSNLPMVFDGGLYGKSIEYGKFASLSNRAVTFSGYLISPQDFTKIGADLAGGGSSSSGSGSNGNTISTTASTDLTITNQSTIFVDKSVTDELKMTLPSANGYTGESIKLFPNHEGHIKLTSLKNNEFKYGADYSIIREPVEFFANQGKWHAFGGSNFYGVNGQVKDIYPGVGSSYPSNLTNIGGILYFSATDQNGSELWKSDGSESGTVQVKDIFPGTSSSSPDNLTIVGSILYFSATDQNGTGLWKSDGSESGTVKVKDITSLPQYLPSIFTNVGGTLYFSADDGTNGTELWKSDGTESGTVQVKDIYPGTVKDISPRSGRSFPSNLTNFGGILYFSADDGTNGTELWKSDGSESGTVQVKDIYLGTSSSSPSNLTNVGSILYFSATDQNGSELWKSDGSVSGTVQVKDIYPGGGSSSPSNLTNVGSILYFSATDQNGTGLWKSDGSVSGTVKLKVIRLQPQYHPSYFTNVGGTLYFSADDGTRNIPTNVQVGTELWKSDGSESGTVQVKDIYPGFIGRNPVFLTNIGGILYFSATDQNGTGIWKSDGTESGTVRVKDIRPGNGTSTPLSNLTDIGGNLYFSANDWYGSELWKLDLNASPGGSNEGNQSATHTVDLNSSLSLEMLWVEPGTFTMGSPTTESGRSTDETEHNVTLTKGFYLGKYEVTQAQYEAVMKGNTDGLNATPSHSHGHPQHPVEMVSWDDTQIFLSRLNALQSANIPAGWAYVLPTESQWEYVCRAGTSTMYSCGDDINSSRANFRPLALLIGSSNVGNYEANPWGFFDMHGNVEEWLSDWYDTYPSGNPVIDPTGGASGSYRVTRGGSWYFGSIWLRSAKRDYGTPSARSSNIGFRVGFQKQ